MKALFAGMGLVAAGIVVGVFLDLVTGMALLVVGAGALLVSLIGFVDANAAEQDDISARADEVRRQNTLF